MSEPRSMPAWLRWTVIVLGALLVLAGLAFLGYSGLGIWTLYRSPKGLMDKSGQTLAIYLAKVLASVIAMLIGAWIMQTLTKKKEFQTETFANKLAKVSSTSAAASVIATQPVKRGSRKRWQSANVLQLGEASRRLWSFGASRRGFTLSSDQSLAATGSLPAKTVGKDWRTLFQPKLNVAWLPVDQVFLRVAQLPAGDFEETLQMVELQLEKLSPLPVTQICWSIHTLPGQVDNLQTIIITIIGRDIVEKYLGDLEGQGFLADRLELPMVDQLQATPITGDGAWVYPGSDTGKFTALIAWWYGGVLRNLALLHVPAADNRDALFKEQITQMAWAGELEGWLTSAPRWHLVADETVAAAWRPLFQSATGQAPDMIEPLNEVHLAQSTANRAARANPKSNILPAEFSTRYHSQFVDRLWMRGVGAVIIGYLAGVMIYMAIASVQNYRADSVEMEMRNLSGQYTNTLQLKAKVQILSDRQDLKNAALDTWKVTAEQLPEGLTVQSLEIKNDKSFTIFGNAPRDGEGLVNDFNDSMRKAVMDQHPFFSRMDVALTHVGGNGVSWSFGGEVAHAEGSQ